MTGNGLKDPDWAISGAPAPLTVPVDAHAGGLGAGAHLTRAVRVRVPATSANLGPGFDALGLALGLYDDVEVEVAGSGLSIEVSGEGEETADRGEGHLIVRMFRAAYASVGGEVEGLRIRCVNRIPHARGLGSSSAATIAGILAARALHPEGHALTDDDVLALATSAEGHPDNVAPCLAGGLTVAWQTPSGPRLTRLDVAEGVRPVVLVPDTRLATERARGLLPETVPHADAAANAGRAALLVAALTAAPRPSSRRDRGPAAPVLPRPRDARFARVGRAVARERGRGGDLRCGSDGSRAHVPRGGT